MRLFNELYEAIYNKGKLFNLTVRPVTDNSKYNRYLIKSIARATSSKIINSIETFFSLTGN